MEYLSNSQLYFSTEVDFSLTGEEAHHVIRVMRHRIGDKIFITNGKGLIRESKIISIENNRILTGEEKNFIYENQLKHFTFCIPILKNPDRLSFAIEKSVELGITNFTFYLSGVSLKKEIKLERFSKIGIAAMKQSLRAYLPDFQKISSLSDLNYENIFYFDQKGKTEITSAKFGKDKSTVFIFGSESGFSQKELEYLNNRESLKLSENRLRSETAIVTAASLLSICNR